MITLMILYLQMRLDMKKKKKPQEKIAALYEMYIQVTLEFGQWLAHLYYVYLDRTWVDYCNTEAEFIDEMYNHFQGGYEKILADLKEEEKNAGK